MKPNLLENNDGTRTLFEAVVSPEVVKALRDWSAQNNTGVLIGGLALSHYGRPRATQDVDILMLSDSDIPEKIPDLIKIVTPTLVNVASTVFEKVIDTAIESDGVKIASPSGIVALKLNRFSLQDRADIVELIRFTTIDISGFDLPQTVKDRFLVSLSDAESDPLHRNPPDA
jgi:hypothetical protein